MDRRAQSSSLHTHTHTPPPSAPAPITNLANNAVAGGHQVGCVYISRCQSKVWWQRCITERPATIAGDANPPWGKKVLANAQLSPVSPVNQHSQPYALRQPKLLTYGSREAARMTYNKRNIFDCLEGGHWDVARQPQQQRGTCIVVCDLPNEAAELGAPLCRQVFTVDEVWGEGRTGGRTHVHAQ